MESNEKKSFKEQLLELVEGMKKDEFNFDEDAAIFNWDYDEVPDLRFQLVIFQKGNVSDHEDDDDQMEFDFGDHNVSIH